MKRGFPWVFWLFAMGAGMALPLHAQEEDFKKALSLTARKYLEWKGKRLTPIRKVNESYDLTAQAVLTILESANGQRASDLLRKSVMLYRDNRLAHLLLGRVYETMGRKEEAAGAYLRFYRGSESVGPVEIKLIDPQAHQIFQEFVANRLQSWGITLPERRIPRPIQMFRTLSTIEESRLGPILRFLLPGIVMMGFISFLVGRLLNIEISPESARVLRHLFLLCVAGYLLWLAHLFLGLPFFISLDAEFGLLFLLGGAPILTLPITKKFLRERRELQNPQNIRCPHCRKIILRVAAECPFCRRKL